MKTLTQLFLGSILACAIGVMGCSDSDGGAGGNAGTGGSAGTGGNAGTGGTGGTAMVPGCGTQLAYAGLDGTATPYTTLATVLADDQLYVNASKNTCDAYLGAEAELIGLLPDGGCGGRTPQYDVIDVSYSVLALGAFSGVSDGVDASPATGEDFTSTFPFLKAAVPPAP